MSEQSKNLDELRRLNEKLGAILADAEPGLLTWRFAVSDLLLKMADYAGYGWVSTYVKEHQFEVSQAKAPE